MDPCSIGSKQKAHFLDGILNALNEHMTRSGLLKCGTQVRKTPARKSEELLVGGNVLQYSLQMWGVASLITLKACEEVPALQRVPPHTPNTHTQALLV